MGRFLAIVMLATVTMAQLSFADAKPEQQTDTQSVSQSAGASALPPLPSGKSTVIGGAIRDVDPVRDQFTLKVFGGRSMKILFDARTHFYRDGVRTSLRNLRPEAHASVETMLDGTQVFARSIHILSRAPEGEFQGQVVSYNPATGELTVSAALSHQPIELRVPAGTPIVRVGQLRAGQVGLASDLVKGTLISAKFASDNKGGGIVRQIAVLAVPGSTFVFRGNIAFLDLHSGLLALLDPRDNKSYKISFDPARFPVSRSLHEGAHVTVTATFDGAGYVATAITVH